MKTVKTFIFINLIISTTFAQSICEGTEIMPIVTFNQCNSDPWILVFEDNFNGYNLDLSKWDHTFQDHNRYCNGEQQYYTNGENCEVSNGTLKIIAKEETVFKKTVDYLPADADLYRDDEFCGRNERYFWYTSANIQSKYNFSFGKYEARIKIPPGKGLWPAFWLFGGDPVWNEIDIFEFFGEDPFTQKIGTRYEYQGTLRDCGSTACLMAGTPECINYSSDYHIFTLIWEKNKIEWYVDNVHLRTDYRYYTLLGQSIGCTVEAYTPYIMNISYPVDPMHIIFNLAIQTDPHAPDNNTTFPAQMEVDWFRYYKRNSCQNVNITEYNEFPLTDGLINFLVGSEVTINCDYNINSNQQFHIISQNSILLKSGFNAKKGSNFRSTINSSACNSAKYNYSNLNNSANSAQKLLGKSKFFLETKSFIDIHIFPNPAKNQIQFQFESATTSSYSLIIRDVYGNTIITESNYQSGANLNISTLSNGIYIAEVVINGQVYQEKFVVM